jgi:hypothetical protein
VLVSHCLVYYRGDFAGYSVGVWRYNSPWRRIANQSPGTIGLWGPAAGAPPPAGVGGGCALTIKQQASRCKLPTYARYIYKTICLLQARRREGPRQADCFNLHLTSLRSFMYPLPPPGCLDDSQISHASTNAAVNSQKKMTLERAFVCTAGGGSEILFKGNAGGACPQIDVRK